MKAVTEMALDELIEELRATSILTTRCRDLIYQIEKLKIAIWVPTTLERQGHYIQHLDEY